MKRKTKDSLTLVLSSLQLTNSGRRTIPFLLSMILTLCMGFLPVRAQSIHNSYYVLLKGKVTEANGKPVSGVAVTDGTHIVWTNAQGTYELPGTTESMFVYITIPSGYEIPTDNNMALFYKRIEPVNGMFHADFTLSRLKQNDNHHFLILWADPQINNQDDANKLDSTVVPDTRAYAHELMKKGPVVGIAAGDLSWDAPSIIPEYKKAVKETGVPFFQVLGNHDMDVNVRTDEQSDSTFHKSMGPSWYSFNRGKAHYIVMDNVFYYANGYNYIGYLTEREFQWLQQDLSVVKPGSLVFVSMHIPGYTEYKRIAGAAEDNIGDITSNRKFLYELLKPYRAHLLTGHTHYNENRIEAGVYEHIHAAVCGTWWVSPLCGDGTPRGYGVYEINGDSLTWYYKSAGYPANYQMRVYNRGVYQNKPKDVAVNVWNWDKDWKVEWYEDGNFKGSMRHEIDKDAAVTKLLTGPDKPLKYPWIQPLLTDHMFFATPSANARMVRVVVTDRFGHHYQQEIRLNK